MTLDIAPVSALPAHETPDDLDTAGLKLWNEISSQWDFRPDETKILLEACRMTDEIESMSHALKSLPMIVEGAQGQQRVHPIFTELRAHRLALKQLLNSLGIAEADGDPSAIKSAAGRRMARARWDKSH